MSAAERTKVGFVGLGTMGWPMSANIARAGFDVVGIDADPELAAALGRRARSGRRRAGREDFADVGVVVTMLPNGAIVRKAILDGGIADALPDGAVVMDMSSAEPSATLSLAPELESRGVGLVDAPVSGARTKAIDGTLTIMLGGEDEAAIEKVTPVLEAMSANIFRTGPIGSGHAMKALNNYVGGAGFVAACEALRGGDEVRPGSRGDDRHHQRLDRAATSRRRSLRRPRSSRGGSPPASRSRCSRRTSASRRTSPTSSTSTPPSRASCSTG